MQTLFKIALLTGLVFMTTNNTPRGIRNNNPGNIRGANFTWDGETGRDDKDFVIFHSPVMGLRALSRVLRTYRDKHNLITIEGVLSRYAPSEENNTRAYIDHAVRILQKGADIPLNYDDYFALIKVIVQHENGAQPYSDEQINLGLELGFLS